MFCTNCGQKIGDTAMFCTNCGTPTKKQQSNQTQAPVEIKPMVNESAKNELPIEPKVESPVEGNSVEPNVVVLKPVEFKAEETKVHETKAEETKAEETNMEQPVGPKAEQPVAPITTQLLGNNVHTPQSMVNQTMDEPLPQGQNFYNQQPIQENKKFNKKNKAAQTPKKSKKKLIIIAGVSAVILLVGAGVGYFMYQNHIMKQVDNVMAYLDDEEYDDAIDLYEKYSGKKAAFDDKITKELLTRAEQIKENYLSEKLDYDTALDQLYSLEDYDIKKLDKLVKEVSQSINRINSSRESYQEAKMYYEQGDYVTALDRYSLVLKEDDKYYKLATKDMEQIEQEEAKREEEERINNLRDQALYDAESYAYSYDYKEAIQIIEQGLIEIPGDSVLSDQLAYYQGLQEMAIAVENITSTKYEQTYQEQDKDIMTVSLEIPVLEGDNPAYASINQVLESLKGNYIDSSEQLAEDARWYAYEDYFYPYSYDITYSVQYNDNGVLCLMMEGYIFTGGAHGFPVRDVYTFDLASGAQLYLGDLIATDETMFGSYVTAEFQRMFEETPGEYWLDAPDTVQSNATYFGNMYFYLMKDGISIYYYPYDLASYARGFVDIIIPYAGNEWMFEFLQ